MEGDVEAYLGVPVDIISTHALTWRATVLAALEIFEQLFLPTPSHGGRPCGCGAGRNEIYFYPRPHMEGDRHQAPEIRSRSISTHALTWRATRHPPYCTLIFLFLPTPSHGGRLQKTPILYVMTI